MDMVGIYVILLGLIFILGAHRLLLTLLYLRHKSAPPTAGTVSDVNITVQLPIYNERNVVEPLLSSVCNVEWSRGNLEIQVLDDSTDDTQHILQNLVLHYQQQGVNIQYLHRQDRTGYKAGALAEGLLRSRGEYIAIFDADFLPDPNFLERAIDYFTETQIGMVQARWTHQNREQNILTALSAILLDGHFVIEHTARNRSGRFFNFNGTAGIWRRSCIEDAGGWQHDTITEDLDISYRAQLRGWKFVYLRDITAAAELPSTIPSFTTQQFRWAKGTTQTALKLGKRIWRAPLSFWIKLEASFHLLSNIGYPLTLILTVLLPISSILHLEHDFLSTLSLSVFVMTTLSIFFFYGLSQYEIKRYHGAKMLFFFPMLLALGVGISVQQSKAIYQGLRNNDHTFVRTPKKGRQTITEYALRHRSRGILEIILSLYCFLPCPWLLYTSSFSSLPFLLLFSIGYAYVGIGFFLSGFPSRTID